MSVTNIRQAIANIYKDCSEYIFFQVMRRILRKELREIHSH